MRICFSDIDGVWTDGTMTVSDTGVVSKTFHTYDSWGVKTLKDKGIPLHILTGDMSDSTVARLTSLGVPRHWIHRGVTDKRKLAHYIATHYGTKLSECGYIGDDMNDLDLLQSVGFPAIPCSAHPSLVACLPDVFVTCAGGTGAFRHFVDHYA